MVQLQFCWTSALIKTFLLVLLCTQTASTRKPKRTLCPIGYSAAYPKYKNEDPVCYRKKGPEAFEDKYKDCAGNLYTSKLYKSLNITEKESSLWTEYKSLYPGGPFIDYSYTLSTGDILLSTFDVNYDTNLGLDNELCVVIDPISNFTAVKCDEKHYSYCIFKPYVDESDMDRDGCKDVKGYWRFWSPRASCLTALTGVGGGAVRANWRQAKDLCAKRGGSLLNKGWKYANNPLLYTDEKSAFPLGIVLSPDNKSIRFDITDDHAEIPPSDWFFENSNVNNDSTLGALHDSFWYLVNNSYIFYDVICERPIELQSVSLTVSVDREGKLILTTNKTIDETDIYCFTDSVIYFPAQIKVRQDGDSNIYVLKPIADGYYWCLHVNSRNYIVSESNKALFIREKQSLVNYYAIQIRLPSKYKFVDLEENYREWEKKLEEYIFYRNKYIRVFGEMDFPDTSTTEEALQAFKAAHPGLKWKEKDLIYKIKIKRLYLDGKTALVHVQLNPEMMAVTPGYWDGLEVVFMKPVYYCKGFDSVPMLPMGSSVTSPGCRTHSCVGEFNEGVQWVTTATDDCTVPLPTTLGNAVNVNDHGIIDVMPTVESAPTQTSLSNIRATTSDSSEETSTTDSILVTTESNYQLPTTTDEPKPVQTVDTTQTWPSEVVTTAVYTLGTLGTTDIVVTTVLPTLPTKPPPPPPPTTLPPTRPPPEQQLQQVMDDLNTLLDNDTVTVTVDKINEAFDQVDFLLSDMSESNEQLEIPGQLLHIFDKIGSRIDLNGSHSATAVRDNIALLVADAEPDQPVRGIKIAARDEDVFTNEAFQIISEEVNSTHLTVNDTEAVVHLPESVSTSNRRISFVVFRNDRAFTSVERLAINSRVLSINVENLTHFESGEYIDIHLSPMVAQPDRNVSRICAYWSFLEDGTGFWSTDGCILIKSSQEGILDTCRCNHLTHFAEVLVTRSVFSENNEQALEVLSVIGCCLSIFGLLMIGVTAALFRSWRRDYSNKIWLQLCVAIFLLVICFLIVVFAKFDHYNVACMLVGVALHYSVLASFCWMLVAAVLSYRRLVIVFTRDASHKLLRASAFSWGTPCAVVGILLSVAPHAFEGRFDDKTPTAGFCYPSGLALWLSLYAPVALILLANWTLFALIVRSVFASRRIQRHGDSNEALRCASVSCLLVFLFGLPWIFGLFAYNIFAAYIFTLTATFQGFVLFLFFVVGNKKTRDLWLNKLKIKQTRKVPVTSSTYTNRSTGQGYRGPIGVSTIEANSSKPRSLASPDDSRFS